MVDTVLTSSHKKILNVVYVLNLTKISLNSHAGWYEVGECLQYRNSALHWYRSMHMARLKASVTKHKMCFYVL